MAEGLMKAFDPGGEKQVADAYFLGASPLFDKVKAAFGTANANQALRDWQKKSRSDAPADWPAANQMLATALAHPAPPQAPPKATAPPATTPAATTPAATTPAATTPEAKSTPPPAAPAKTE
jgi:hypothetical protein